MSCGASTTASRRTSRRRSRTLYRGWRHLAVGRNRRGYKDVPCVMLGSRNASDAQEFVADLASRLTHRVQLTSDGHRPYLEAVESAFGADIDYAMLVKLYGHDQDNERRYQSRDMHRCISDRHNWPSGSVAHLDQLRGTPELDCPHVDGPLHALVERIQPEDRKSHGGCCDQLLRLQLHRSTGRCA